MVLSDIGLGWIANSYKVVATPRYDGDWWLLKVANATGQIPMKAHMDIIPFVAPDHTIVVRGHLLPGDKIPYFIQVGKTGFGIALDSKQTGQIVKATYKLFEDCRNEIDKYERRLDKWGNLQSNIDGFTNDE